MANFAKTTKAEKIVIAVLTVTLIAGLTFLFINDKNSSTNQSKASDSQLIDPITAQ